MKNLVLKLICCLIAIVSFSVGLPAQTERPASRIKFKPRYAGTSLDAGLMFTPNLGSGFFVAPKVCLQATPRLFVNAGIGVVQYNLLPVQMNTLSEGGSQQRALTGTYIFTDGVYLLSERWSLKGSMMKNITPEPMRRVSPFHMPNEAINLGVDFRVTPNITVGARVGYTTN